MAIFGKLFSRNKPTSELAPGSLREFIAFLNPKSIEILLERTPQERKVAEHTAYLTMSFVGIFLTVLEKNLLVFKDSFEKNGKPWLFDYENLFVESLCYTIFVQMSFYLYMDRAYNMKTEEDDLEPPNKEYFEFLTTVMARTSFFCDYHFSKQNLTFDPAIFIERIEEYSEVLFKGDDHLRHFEAVMIDRLDTDEFGELSPPKNGYKSAQIIALQLAEGALNIGEFDGIVAKYWRDSRA